VAFANDRHVGDGDHQLRGAYDPYSEPLGKPFICQNLVAKRAVKEIPHNLQAAEKTSSKRRPEFI